MLDGACHFGVHGHDAKIDCASAMTGTRQSIPEFATYSNPSDDLALVWRWDQSRMAHLIGTKRTSDRSVDSHRPQGILLAIHCHFHTSNTSMFLWCACRAKPACNVPINYRAWQHDLRLDGHTLAGLTWCVSPMLQTFFYQEILYMPVYDDYSSDEKES